MLSGCIESEGLAAVAPPHPELGNWGEIVDQTVTSVIIKPMRHTSRLLLLALALFTVALLGVPVIDACPGDGDDCGAGPCPTACVAFCCGGLVALTEVPPVSPVRTNVSQVLLDQPGTATERPLEPPVRPPRAA